MEEVFKNLSLILGQMPANTFAVGTLNRPNFSIAANNQMGVSGAICKDGRLTGSPLMQSSTLGSASRVAEVQCGTTTQTHPNYPYPNITKLAMDARSDGQIAAAAICTTGGQEVKAHLLVEGGLGPGSLRVMMPFMAEHLNEKCKNPSNPGPGM